MADERMIRALGRLEEALLRAEAAGAAAAETGAARDSLERALAGLEARHQRLRASAANAIDELDRLIASPTETAGG